MSQARRQESPVDVGGLHALFSRVSRNAERAIVPINASALGAHGSRPAFYCVHSLSGAGGTDFTELANLLPEVRFFGVQAPSAKMRAAEFGGSVESIADYYAAALDRFQPEGPMLLGGWSAGVAIGLEVARNLRARGRVVGLFAAIDAAPENSGAGLPAWHPLYLMEIARNMQGWITHDFLSQKNPVRSLARRASAKAAAIGKSATAANSDPSEVAAYTIASFLELSRYPPDQRSFITRLYRALMAYKPNEYLGRVVVYEAQVRPLFNLPQVGRIWRSLAPHSVIVSIAGTHSSILRGTYVQTLADDLRKRVAEIAD